MRIPVLGLEGEKEAQIRIGERGVEMRAYTIPM